MQKRKERTGETHPPSKYAQKLADEATGKREPFEFGSGRISLAREKAAASAVSTTSGKVRATVTHVHEPVGCAFLETEGGESVFVGFNILQRSAKTQNVRKGLVVECEIAPHPNGKGLRVTRIFSVTPPAFT